MAGDHGAESVGGFTFVTEGELFSETRSSELHGDKILKKLHIMKKKGVACDLAIIVNGYQFNVHRNVVMAASNYLEKYFSRDGWAHINLDMLPIEGVSACIDFMYTGEVQLTSSNVASLLQAAHLLEIYDLINLCLQVLRRHLSVRTCALTSRLFYLYGNEEGKVAVDVFMALVLLQFGGSLKHQLPLRERNTLKKYSKMGCWDIVSVHPSKPSVGSKMVTFRNAIYLVEKNKMSFCSPTSGTWTEGLPGTGIGDCCLAVAEDFMYAIEGNKARRYSPVSKCWTKIASPNVERTAATATYYDGKIYLLGGDSTLLYFDDVEAYDIKKNKWRREPGMIKPCGYHAAVVQNQTLIVAGGWRNGDIVQIFDKGTGTWTTKKMEKKERIQLAACTL